MDDILELIGKEKIIPVLRTEDHLQTEIAVDELLKAGFRIIEITMTVKGAIDIIKKLSFLKGIILGAGTVMDSSTAQGVINAGAKFIVSPHLDFDIMKFAVSNNLLYIPGCGTVTEIVNGTKSGAKVVKVFPASSLGGPNFIKAILAALPQAKLIPTGGVNKDNLLDYLKAGAYAVGMSELIDKEALKQNKAGNTFNIAKQIKDKIIT
ncbi:MAG: bifunctional 4-hydroxy-2-oxoglutarate aldolase/2-dehydro-3-deoxy-phosphogluconate aldolase [Candidatus Hydrogenedentota bacterium]